MVARIDRGMKMKSDAVKKGIERAPHRSLLYAVGCSREELDKPFIGVVNSFTDIVPGHVHLRDIAAEVGIFNYYRSEMMNDRPEVGPMLADVVEEHL